jgi:hypothetical protein
MQNYDTTTTKHKLEAIPKPARFLVHALGNLFHDWGQAVIVVRSLNDSSTQLIYVQDLDNI